tara:strand:- start:42 stop:290 length:249 start_codon:yes stop_codon:yes gene_type:complete
MKYFLIFMFLMSSSFITIDKTKKEKNESDSDWFRIYNKDVEYYTWVSDEGNVYNFTDEELNDLRDTYEIWGDTVHLKAIVLK